MEIGTKTSLGGLLSSITGIERPILKGGQLSDISVTKRMSWASQRVTTRPEDVAYCLMGVFNVNMPLLYGESDKAFIRLQEEIMKESDDHSIFAWRAAKKATSKEDLTGLLAASPADFTEVGDIRPFRDWHVSRPHSITNKGLQIQLPLTQIQGGGGLHYLAILDCRMNGNAHPLAIELRAMMEGSDQFARLMAMDPITLPLDRLLVAKVRTIFIRRSILHPNTQECDPDIRFIIRSRPPSSGLKIRKFYPPDRWVSEETDISLPAESCQVGAVLIENVCGDKTVLIVGYNESDRQAWCKFDDSSLQLSPSDISLQRIVYRYLDYVPIVESVRDSTNWTGWTIRPELVATVMENNMGSQRVLGVDLSII